MDKENKNHLLIAIALGAGVSAIAAMLLAPKTGNRLFSDLSGSVNAFSKRAKGAHKYSSDENWFNEHYLLWGGVGATLMAALSGILLTPKKEEIKEFLKGSYDDICDKTSNLVEYLNDKGQELTQSLQGSTAEWTEKALEIADSLTEEVDVWSNKIRETSEKAQKTLSGMAEGPARKKIEEIVNWSEKAMDMADDVTESVKAWTESIRDSVTEALKETKKGKKKAASPSQHSLPEIAEWITIGMNLWSNLKGDSKHPSTHVRSHHSTTRRNVKAAPKRISHEDSSKRLKSKPKHK